MAHAQQVRARRVYEDPERADGTRVLVDRIWPRGLSKEKAALDEWCKAVAPSTALRQWYGHDPEKFAEFGRRYRAELRDAEHTEALRHLRELAGERTLTLLTATRDCEISAAAVLTDILGGQGVGSGSSRPVRGAGNCATGHDAPADDVPRRSSPG